MKRIVPLTACVALLVAGTVFRAKAQSSGFSNQNLHDKYGFHVLALSLDPSKPAPTGSARPFAISGYYDFHGDGTLNGVDTVVPEGSSFPGSTEEPTPSTQMGLERCNSTSRQASNLWGTSSSLRAAWRWKSSLPFPPT